MNNTYDKADSAKHIKPYTFIKGCVLGKELHQTPIALPVGRKPHDILENCSGSLFKRGLTKKDAILLKR